MFAFSFNIKQHKNSLIKISREPVCLQTGVKRYKACREVKCGRLHVFHILKIGLCLDLFFIYFQRCLLGLKFSRTVLVNSFGVFFIIMFKSFIFNRKSNTIINNFFSPFLKLKPSNRPVALKTSKKGIHPDYPGAKPVLSCCDASTARISSQSVS